MDGALGLLAGALLFVTFSGAMADQSDRRLGPLFERLKAATDTAEANEIATSIRSLWAVSGNEEADRLMAVGLGALRDGAVWDALRSFDLVVYRAPYYAEAYNMRATANFLMGNLPDAITNIERVLELEPRHFGALVGLGTVHLAMKDEAAALAAFERALAINPHLERARARTKELRSRQ